ncbi:MAG: conjugal transfer protein TraX [Treponema sp.]|jgi:hypothetical protein|nr:conjugal transfer protein TraX [Treponema sp.]
MDQYKILTANKLKVFAIIVMFLDHFATVFFPSNVIITLIFKLLGRMAAPIFCFFIAQGYHYTSNLKKYTIRLLAFAAISHIPYLLAFHPNNLVFGLGFLKATSVILPLAMGLIALAAIKSSKIHIILKPVILAACCAVSYTANWNYIAVLWVVAFGLFHGNFLRQSIAFCIICVFYLLIQPFRLYGIFHETYPQWQQFGIFLSLLLLAMYNGQPGKKSPAMKWIFYIFYPAHLILLYLLNQFTVLEEILKKLW